MKKYRAGWLLLVLALCLCLSACNSTDYKKALQLEAAGDYAAAMEIFERLGSYKDAAAQLAQCGSAISYEEAVEAQEKGNYARAAELFESLGAFSDAGSRLEECNTMLASIRAFDDAAEALERKNAEMDLLIAESREMLLSDLMVPDEALVSSMLQYADQVEASLAAVPPVPDTPEELAAAVESMSAVNYDEASDRLHSFLDESREKYRRVSKPKEEYIVSCLERVPGVTNIKPGTESNVGWSDYDKNGSFYSCVFFDHVDVDMSKREEKPIVDIYLDKGGQIEAYATVNAAKTKFDTLQSYQGTAIGMGYNVLVGTVIVRVSDLLDETVQKELSQRIIAELTNLNPEETEEPAEPAEPES